MDASVISPCRERQLRIAHDVGAGGLRKFEQRGIESPPVQLQAFAVQLEHEIVGVRCVAAPERECAVAGAMTVGQDTIQRAEIAQQMTRRRRQTFADFEHTVPVHTVPEQAVPEQAVVRPTRAAGIGQQHAITRTRQHDRGGGPGRATAGDGDIVCVRAHRFSRVCGRDAPATARRWRLPANRNSHPPAAYAPSDAT